jgi:hypothetical protein
MVNATAMKFNITLQKKNAIKIAAYFSNVYWKVVSNSKIYY